MTQHIYRKNKFGYLCLVTNVDIDILMKFVVTKNALFIVVKKDIQDLVNTKETMEDVNLKLNVVIAMRNKETYLKIVIKLLN